MSEQYFELINLYYYSPYQNLVEDKDKFNQVLQKIFSQSPDNTSDQTDYQKFHKFIYDCIESEVYILLQILLSSPVGD